MAGRYRKYRTAEDLQAGVDSYFDSIAYEATATNAAGETLYNVMGEPITYIDYAVPPSKEALCLHLGISLWTWRNYRQDPMFAEIVDEADTKIRGWRVAKTSTTERTAGYQFLLSNDSDMRDRLELGLDGKTREALSMADRKSLLMEIKNMMEEDMDDS